MKKEALLIMGMLLHFSLFAQVQKSDFRYDRNYLHWTESVDGKIVQFVRVDTITKDTIRMRPMSGHYFYQMISSEGIVTQGPMEGRMGHECGCEREKHGKWMTFYENKKLKEIGYYRCSQKIGKWLTYSESGNLILVENYDLAYPLWTRNNRQSYLNGFYKEYFPNGKIKVSGQYQIFESYEKYIVSFNPETFETEEEKCCQWVPKSVKIGIWEYYDEEGNLIKKEQFEKDKNLRHVEESMIDSEQVWERY